MQHLATAERLLGDLGVELSLLTGDVPKKELDVRRQRIAAGEPLIAIGTHALLHADFRRLLVAVIDEQHRFGVDQREALGGGATPHVLHMTATPIPRSLALTLYGDLDVTVLDELPPGRTPVRTATVPEEKRERRLPLDRRAGAGRPAGVHRLSAGGGLGGGRGARRRGGGEPAPRPGRWPRSASTSCTGR